MSSKAGKKPILSKSQLRKTLEDTSVSQDNISNRLQARNECKHIDSLIDNKHSKTLNNLDNNELENTLQSTLHLLDVEYNKLLKVQETTQRDLEKVKIILSEEIKQQQLNHTQALLSNSHSEIPDSEEIIVKAQKNIELKLKHSHLSKRLAELKKSMRPYEHIPEDIEAAYDKAIQLKAELRNVETQIACATSNRSLNESM